jgi:hypothetical protein
MLINCKKTKELKEMILGNASHNPPALILINDNPVQKVSYFKLLGINISDDLRWDKHVDSLCSKVIASRLYFLKLLNRSGLSFNDLFCFYKSVIRSVLEYASVVWRMAPQSHHRSE